MSSESQKIETVLVAHPSRPNDTMRVNCNDPGLLDGTYKAIEKNDPGIESEESDDLEDDLSLNEDDEDDEDDELEFSDEDYEYDDDDEDE